MTELFRASLAQGEQRDIAARRYVGRIAVEQLSECSPGGRRQLRLPLFLFLGVGGRRLSLEDRDVIDSVVREPRTQRLGCRRFEVSRDALAVEVAAADDPAIKPIGLVQTDDEGAVIQSSAPATSNAMATGPLIAVSAARSDAPSDSSRYRPSKMYEPRVSSR